MSSIDGVGSAAGLERRAPVALRVAELVARREADFAVDAPDLLARDALDFALDAGAFALDAVDFAPDAADLPARDAVDFAPDALLAAALPVDGLLLELPLDGLLSLLALLAADSAVDPLPLDDLDAVLPAPDFEPAAVRARAIQILLLARPLFVHACPRGATLGNPERQTGRWSNGR